MKHWTDAHIVEDKDNSGMFVGYDEAGLELVRNYLRSYVVACLEDYSARLTGTLNYHDGALMHKIMTIIRDLKLMYYVDCDRVVRTYWQGGWVPWHKVMKIDTRLAV